MAISPGVSLGPYKVVSPLGKGGMGEVYRAQDTRLNREVAVKVLPDHLVENETALRRFQREANVLASLSHPNILTIFDIGTEQGLSYVVMELLEGDTLRARMRKGCFPGKKPLKFRFSSPMALPPLIPKESFIAT